MPTTEEIALRLKSIQGPMELRSLAKDAIAALTERDREIARLHDSIQMLESLPGNELVEKYRDRIADVESERDELTRELDTYQNGYQGACTTCEATATRNHDLRERLAKLTRDRDEWMRRAIAAEGQAANLMRHLSGHSVEQLQPERGDLIDNLEEERDVYAMTTERWWRQARQANQDAWSNASIATAAMETIDELREEVEQYKWLLEQAKAGNPAPHDVAKRGSK
jgi:chromosome segregation ATPase